MSGEQFVLAQVALKNLKSIEDRIIEIGDEIAYLNDQLNLIRKRMSDESHSNTEELLDDIMKVTEIKSRCSELLKEQFDLDERVNVIYSGFKSMTS